eukprot:scaffold2422_cov56-Attheya_sp.AAC.12
MACDDILTTPYHPDWMPIDFAVNTDMSGTWKLLDIGGAFKVSHYPCINCAILSQESHKPNTFDAGSCTCTVRGGSVITTRY